MNKKLDEITPEQRTGMRLANDHLDLDSWFLTLKDAVKAMDPLERTVNQQSIIRDLNEIETLVVKFTKKFRQNTDDYEIESTMRVYNGLQSKLRYALDRSSKKDFSWVYLE